MLSLFLLLEPLPPALEMDLKPASAFQPAGRHTIRFGISIRCSIGRVVTGKITWERGADFFLHFLLRRIFARVRAAGFAMVGMVGIEDPAHWQVSPIIGERDTVRGDWAGEGTRGNFGVFP